MRQLIYLSSFVLFAMFCSAGTAHAQYRGAKNGVSARFIQSNYQFPLSEQISEEDFFGGVELEYSRHLFNFLNLSLPVKYARPFIPLDESGLKTLETQVMETDLLLQFKYFRESGFIYPVLFGGFGAAMENWEDYLYYIPAGLTLNFRFRKHAYLNVKGEYRLAFEHNLRDHLILSAGVFVAIGKGIEPDPSTVDTDKDGVPDIEDDCPMVAGLYEVRGCPDTDSDGVPDNEDACPQVAGLYQFRGCPDMDGDGVQDRFDQCPEIEGPINNDGCPIIDMDGDGVKDEEDECPLVAGNLNGCPDRDGDKVKDSEDLCPNLAGSVIARGCPDLDEDGVEDSKDLCPEIAGPPESEGCPTLSAREEAIFSKASFQIKFDSGRSLLNEKSIPILNEIAAILIKYPDYHLTIKGFTDSIGSRSDNQKLSKERAKACFDYLVSKGVSESRMTYEGYGESEPIADNRYAAGREKNRRIEFDIHLDK